MHGFGQARFKVLTGHAGCEDVWVVMKILAHTYILDVNIKTDSHFLFLFGALGLGQRRDKDF